MPTRMLSLTVYAYVAVVAAVAMIYAIGPERLAWGGVTLFLPQIILAIPGFLLLPLVLWRARRLSVVAGRCAVADRGTADGADMEFAPKPQAGIPLRVMTYNMQLWQRRNVPAIMKEILDADPDVLCLQDARATREHAARELLQEPQRRDVRPVRRRQQVSDRRFHRRGYFLRRRNAHVPARAHRRRRDNTSSSSTRIS